MHETELQIDKSQVDNSRGITRLDWAGLFVGLLLGVVLMGSIHFYLMHKAEMETVEDIIYERERMSQIYNSILDPLYEIDSNKPIIEARLAEVSKQTSNDVLRKYLNY